MIYKEKTLKTGRNKSKTVQAYYLRFFTIVYRFVCKYKP
jgi:hypothetical protein